VSDRTCGLCQQPITEGQSRVMEYRDGHVITAHRTCAGRAYPAPTGPLIAPAPVSEEEGSEGRLTALATTWAARITSESERVSSVAECVCRHGYFWGECYECCRVALIGAFKEAAAPAPPPSTGDEAPVRCAHGVAICMECAADDYASPRAQTGTDEGVSLKDWNALLTLIAEVCGEEDPEAAVADEFDPWEALRRLRSAALRREEREPRDVVVAALHRACPFKPDAGCRRCRVCDAADQVRSLPALSSPATKRRRRRRAERCATR
jgi:hypothetical protein